MDTSTGLWVPRHSQARSNQHHSVLQCQRCKLFENRYPQHPHHDICICQSSRSSLKALRRLVALPLLVGLPLALGVLILIPILARSGTSSDNFQEPLALVDTDTDFYEPDILKEVRTKFVAPSAMRLPRSKRGLQDPSNNNATEDIIQWKHSTDSPEEGDSSDLHNLQELYWQLTPDTTTAEPSITLQPLRERNIEWPADFSEKKAIRASQARLMLEYMDVTTDPCSDFYQYACGRWAQRHPIPRDKAGFDTFELLRERLNGQLRLLLEQEEYEAGDTQSSMAINKAKDLYKSCMDVESLESRGSEPLVRLLDRLGGWPVIEPHWDPASFDWIRLMAELRRMNNDILISKWIGPDIKHSDENIIQFDQTTLGLPSRDYFLQPGNTAYLQAYRTFMIRVISLLGASLENATASADEIVSFETEIARLTGSNEERRNVSALYRRWTLVQLETKLPGIEWRRYLTLVLGFPPSDSEPVVVFAEKYLHRLGEFVKITPPRTVANYLLWRFVRHRVGNLDERFQAARQRFYSSLFGHEQAPPRWADCVAQVNSNMGIAVGALFVKKHFDENSKNDTLHMTREMQKAFRDLVSDSNWLDEHTKVLATDKVGAMTLRIGYPDYILSWHKLDERYELLNISSFAYFENMVALLRHASREERARLGSPVNKMHWNTAPAVVNAYYSRNKNQIMFPAGILQPPFYHRHFPKSLNFGGIGVVIGHEITHGFDDKGRLFDKTGNMQRWWPDVAIQGFHRRAQCLIEQYSKYTVDEVAMAVDGMNTQGENIADNGGIKQAFMAYRQWLDLNGDADETLPNINATAQQLFFINFAQVWCGAMRPEATRNKLKTAVHSPGRFRVIGTLSNFEEFAQVFQCPLGSAMHPDQKCSVW